MANADTTLDLDALHEAVIAGIAEQFPDVATVEDYREERRSLPLPAILVELVDFEANPEDDPGTEQLPVLARFEARVIIGFREPVAERAIRRLAGALGAFVHLRRWGQPVGPAEVLTISPDDFEPDLDQYLVWRVEWQQPVHLGATVWVSDEALPETVLYSYTPRVGIPYEEEYRELGDGAAHGELG